MCGATVGPPPGLAAENTSVLVGIQRYRQRQYVAEQGRLSDEEVLEALMGWQLALDMVTAHCDPYPALLAASRGSCVLCFT